MHTSENTSSEQPTPAAADELSRPAQEPDASQTTASQPARSASVSQAVPAATGKFRDAKGGSAFRFKQFAVEQSRSAMKVGTDGVLLGAWVDLGLPGATPLNRILDIGTGTGVIALMLAQRTAAMGVTATIDGVEADPEATSEATLNFASSPWSDRLQTHLTPIQQYTSPTRYDLIVSNPPYFMAGTDFRRGFDTSSAATQPTAARIAARHAEMLPYDDLIESTLRLLAPEGRFAAIFPYRESGIFIAKAAARGLYVQRMLEVHGAPHKPVKRVAVEMSRHRTGRETVIRESLSIEDGHGHFTAAYRELTRDFYLKF
ncbi:tRNA1(Val) (adenine(37)-N6)-methyltransferase [Millionella massiliensis]|uniref:tRNA1(Val) (adenine(37)-N6)-methyltransferase n=1 Tax=Millionella massiliensis TaxID=1871023 RepID=UPI0023A82ECE|nr:methyltransferase [Millionella massiliensis]